MILWLRHRRTTGYWANGLDVPLDTYVVELTQDWTGPVATVVDARRYLRLIAGFALLAENRTIDRWPGRWRYPASPSRLPASMAALTSIR
jgi:hypothetical protein